MMHLIQEEKHKSFQAEDWFQLINAMHQFLTEVGPQADMDQLKELQSQHSIQMQNVQLQVEQLAKEVESRDRHIHALEGDIRVIIEENDVVRRRASE